MVINFSNRAAYTFIVLGIIAAAAFFVSAYDANPDTGTPSTMGHSRGELNLSPIFINPTNDYIGINNPNPAIQLDVNGGAIFRGGGVALWNDGITSLFLTSFPFCGEPSGALKTGAGGQVYCDYSASSGGVSSTGTSGWISKFTTSGNNIGNSVIYESAGSVGIGVTAPGSKLEVRNNPPADANTAQLSIMENSGSERMFIGRTTTYGFIQTHSGDPLSLNPLANNVGIGTTTAGSKLTVAGDIELSGAIKNPSGDVVIQLG
ncbi:MAG: hypothetical protein AABW50_04480 [Nanoarchaeota archaeon]